MHCIVLYIVKDLYKVSSQRFTPAQINSFAFTTLTTCNTNIHTATLTRSTIPTHA